MAVTKTELKSSFLKDIEESEAYKANVQSIQDWLTGQTQVAQQKYQQTAQTAATQASYDISGAYANYLKQQRNVAAQGRLETGYKEELGDVLKSQYDSAYQQARTKQAESVASAAETYAKNVSSYSESAEKAASQIYSAAEKEAQLKANIYKFAEEELVDFDEEAFYTTGEKSGDVEITPYGVEQFRKYLLQDETFKQRLEEEGLTEELEYYLSDSQNLHKQLFGVESDVYDAKSKESVLGRMYRGDKYTQETLEKAYDATGGTGVFGKGTTDYAKFFDVYRDEYGLTDDEIKDALLAVDDKQSLVFPEEQGKKTPKSLENVLMFVLDEGLKSGKANPAAPVDYIHKKLVNAANKKYQKK